MRTEEVLKTGLIDVAALESKVATMEIKVETLEDVLATKTGVVDVSALRNKVVIRRQAAATKERLSNHYTNEILRRGSI
jgi:hypothetical protein